MHRISETLALQQHTDARTDLSISAASASRRALGAPLPPALLARNSQQNSFWAIDSR